MSEPLPRGRVPRLRAALAGAAAIGLGLALVGAGGGTSASAAGAESLPLSGATSSGLHNTYDPAAFPYLAQALDTGTSMIELDVWDDFITKEWKVSHSNPWATATTASTRARPRSSTPVAPTRTWRAAWTTYASGSAPTPGTRRS